MQDFNEPSAAPASSIVLPPERPFGRRLADFRTQPTASGLLPAEDALLRDTRLGHVCSVGQGVRRNALLLALSDFQRADEKPLMHVAAEAVRTRASGGTWSKAWQSWFNALQQPARDVSLWLAEDVAEIALLDPRLDLSRDVALESNSKAFVRIVNVVSKRLENEIKGWRGVDTDDEATRVRAQFVRFLALGGDDEAPVHELGVQLSGAFVTGALDLDYCRQVRTLTLQHCLIAGTIWMRTASIASLDLTGSKIDSISMQGARVDGDVRLGEGFRADHGVAVSNARIRGSLILSGSVVGSSGPLQANDYDGQRVSFVGDGAEAASILMRDGFCCFGRAVLLGGTVGSNVECTGGWFLNPSRDRSVHAFVLASAKIGATLFLNDDFVGNGGVSLGNIEVRSDVICSGGAFSNRQGDTSGICLGLESARIGGNLFLDENFSSVGLVNLQDLDCHGNVTIGQATLDNLVQGRLVAKAMASVRMWESAFAVSLNGAFVRDSLSISNEAVIRGSFDLRGTHVGTLNDSPQSWPKPVQIGDVSSSDEDSDEEDRKLACVVELDGFRYDRLVLSQSDKAGPSARDRLDWIEPWPPLFADMPASNVFRIRRRFDFRPQPYEHLAKVLREMGYAEQARSILLIKQKRQRTASWLRPIQPLSDPSISWLRWAMRLLVHALGIAVSGIGLFVRWILIGLVLGEGYSKLRPVALAVAVFASCGWLYAQAAQQLAFVPVNPDVYDSADIRQACAGTPSPPPITERIDWVHCRLPPRELTPFYPYLFSADVMMPLVDLGQKREWKPVIQAVTLSFGGHVPPWTLGPTFIDWVVRVQRIGAIVIYLLIAAILAGVIKRD